MNPTPRLVLALTLAVALPVLHAADDYAPHPDSVAQPGVPQGELLKFTFAASKLFPGTTRSVSVYVPKQYDPAKPACVYVNQDGVQHNAPVVFDNLIARGEMPVTIGVFVTPGVVPPAAPDAALPRFNRSFEYDGLGDGYARFLLEEVLPFVEEQKASDGRPLHLSHSGNDRAIGGGSSGAIAAFTAAWERPDAFTRVYSGIGTYVDLRGGGRYANLIRKTEPKPIRVFLQDGSGDLNIYAGDWWMANQAMERALTYARYEVAHAWGEGGHNGKHQAAVFPDAMRFLWKDWPVPVKAGVLPAERIGPVLIPGEGWQLVGEGYQWSEGTATNAQGQVFFTDVSVGKSYTLDAAGRPVVLLADSQRANGQAFGPDGRLYLLATATKQIVAYRVAADGRLADAAVIADGIAGNDLVVAHNGNIYATAPGAGDNKVWLVRPDGSKQEVDAGLKFPNGIALSPDQSLLYVADYRSHWVYSYVIRPDGTLGDKQRFYWLHVPDAEDDSRADGLKVDRNGWLYVATNLGIQVCDQAGRVNLIIPTPTGQCANLVFAGEKFDTLYAACGNKVYKRKLATTGANAWDVPNKPKAPQL